MTFTRISLSSKKILKPFCLALLLGYQSPAICAVTDWVFGGAAVAGIVGWYYNHRRYQAHKLRFKDAELILDAYERVAEVRQSHKAYVNAYESIHSMSKHDVVDGVIKDTLSRFKGDIDIRKYRGDWLEEIRSLYDKMYLTTSQELEELKQLQKKLEAKNVAWKTDAKKELLVPQSEIVLREFARIIPVLELLHEELPYGLCLAFKDRYALLEQEHALAVILGDAKEIKYQLETLVRKDAPADEQYPYCAYYSKLQMHYARLEWVVAKLKGFIPKAHQEVLVADIKTRLIELSALCTYVKNSQEFVAEQKHAEAERRAKEAELKALLAQAKQKELQDEVDRKAHEAQEAARAAQERINALETVVAAHQAPIAPAAPQDAQPSAPSFEDLD